MFFFFHSTAKKVTKTHINSLNRRTITTLQKQKKKKTNTANNYKLVILRNFSRSRKAKKKRKHTDTYESHHTQRRKHTKTMRTQSRHANSILKPAIRARALCVFAASVDLCSGTGSSLLRCARDSPFVSQTPPDWNGLVRVSFSV